MSADPYSLLLERMAAGSPGGMEVEDILAQMGETDPRISLLGKYLARRREAEAEDADEETTDSDERAAAAREQQEAMRSLQRVAKSMFAELEELRGRNDMLAAALGACYICWGEDAGCEVCAGRGAPGSLPPDGELFSMLVVPAVRRVQQRRAGARNAPAQPRPGASDRAMDSNENPN